MATAYLIHTNAYDAFVIPETGAVVPVDSQDGETWAAFLGGDVGDFADWTGGAGWGDEPGFDPHAMGTVIASRDETAGKAEIVDADLLADRAQFHRFAK